MALPSESSQSASRDPDHLSTAFPKSGNLQKANRREAIPSGIRDYYLLIKVGEGNQLTFEMMEAWQRLHREIGAMRGSVWTVEARPPHAIWEFSCYQPFDEVLVVVTEALRDATAWALRCESRMEFAGWSTQELDRLIDGFEAAGA